MLMLKTQPLLVATALLGLSACGIPAEEYDARTAELRKAEDRAHRCNTSVKDEQAKTVELAMGLSDARGQVAALEKDRVSDEARADYRRLLAEAARTQSDAAMRKAARDALAGNLKPEIEAGVVWMDERAGISRMTIPEEALFAEKNSSAVGMNGKKVLDSVARELKALPPRLFVVAAYIDRGLKSKPKEDFSLTVDRARHVAEYLSKQGIEPEQLAAAGWGSAEPIADNANDEARERNRRVEILLLGPVELFPKPVLPVAQTAIGTPKAAGGASSATGAPGTKPPVKTTLGATPVKNGSASQPSTIRIPPAPVAPPLGDDPGL